MRQTRYSETLMTRLPEGTKARLAKVSGVYDTVSEIGRRAILEWLDEREPKKKRPEPRSIKGEVK